MSSSNNYTALLNAACDAMNNSHSPFSGYRVGAAITDNSGTIYIGCNVENSAYGSTICAEAGAVANAIAAGKSERLVAIAIVTATAGTPCGNCRQILAEVAPGCTIILATPETLDTPLETNLPTLLPDPFTGLG